MNQPGGDVPSPFLKQETGYKIMRHAHSQCSNCAECSKKPLELKMLLFAVGSYVGAYVRILETSRMVSIALYQLVLDIFESASPALLLCFLAESVLCWLSVRPDQVAVKDKETALGWRYLWAGTAPGSILTGSGTWFSFMSGSWQLVFVLF